MSNDQLHAMATYRRGWLDEHRQAANRRLSRARINYDRVSEVGGAAEITAARLELKWARADAAEWGPVS